MKGNNKREGNLETAWGFAVLLEINVWGNSSYWRGKVILDVTIILMPFYASSHTFSKTKQIKNDNNNTKQHVPMNHPRMY